MLLIAHKCLQQRCLQAAKKAAVTGAATVQAVAEPLRQAGVVRVVIDLAWPKRSIPWPSSDLGPHVRFMVSGGPFAVFPQALKTMQGCRKVLKAC